MSSFLSSISGSFAKSILLGIVFPVVLFITAVSTVILPLAGASPRSLFAEVFPWETDSTVTALTVFTLIITILLYSLNIPVIRLYEGYPWKESWLGLWCRHRQKARFRAAHELRKRLRVLRWQTRQAKIKSPLLDEMTDLQNAAARASSRFPDREELVLPTRLGNVIRAFEVYPRIRYGMQGVPMWPRLAQILPAEKTAAIEDAKSSFDFMINSSFLGFTAAIALTAVGLVRDHPFRKESGVEWVPWVAFFLLVSYLFYLGAINRAAAWGTQVKAAFDLNRLALLPALGYQNEVAGLEEERDLWQEISFELIYPDSPNLPDLRYKAEQTTLTVSPPSVVVELTRSIDWVGDDVRVTLAVKNVDGARVKADGVEVTEKIAKGLRVAPSSVTLDGGAAKISGVNPFTVSLGEIEWDHAKTLVYRLSKITP